MGFTIAAAQKLDLPALSAYAGGGDGFGRGRGDAPAGDGSRWAVDQLLFGNRPPAPDDQRGHAGRFSGKLQAARGCQAQARNLADDGPKPLLAQAFLYEGKDFPLAPGFGIDHLLRMQSGTHEAGSEQITACQAPEDRPFEAGGDAGREKRCAAGEFGSRPRFDHLVEHASGQAASGQMAIDRAQTEGQGFGLVRPFQPGNLQPQIGKPVLSPGFHGSAPIANLVLMMFLLCSHSRVSQMHAAVAVDFGEKNVS